MSNEDFYEYIKELLKDLLGYHTLPASQELAINFDNKPRDVIQTVGLECIITPKFLSNKFDGGLERVCDTHTVILLQNPQDSKDNISKALLKLQYNFLYKGSIDSIVLWKDVDFTQGARRLVTYTVFIPTCFCEYDPCVAELFDDPLSLY